MTDIIETADIIVVIDEIGINESERAEAAQAAAEAAQAAAEASEESLSDAESRAIAEAARAGAFAGTVQHLLHSVRSAISSGLTAMRALAGQASSAAHQATSAVSVMHVIRSQVGAWAGAAANSAGTATKQAIISTAKAVLTAADAVATAADRVQTGNDAVATAADRVQTGLDRIATAADAVSTADDAAATAADAISTAADRVQTGLDAATATTQAGLAQTAAIAAANSLDAFDDRYLGDKASDPTLDNDGNPLLDGALYWNTSTGLKVYNLGTTTWAAYSAAVGIGSIVEDTTPQLGGQLDVNGFSIGDGALELLKFSETASAVNEITVTNAATGNAPTLSATGDDTNIDLNLAGKGTGVPKIGSSTILKASDIGTSVGYPNVPQVGGADKTSAYPIVLADAGSLITCDNGTTFAVTIPENASVAFPVGSAVTIVNKNATAITIEITTDTLRHITLGTGTRTLAQYGIATILKVSSTTWYIAGSGLN